MLNQAETDESTAKGASTDETKQGEIGKPEGEGKEAQKTYSEAEFEARVKSETDRRVGSAVRTANIKSDGALDAAKQETAAIQDQRLTEQGKYQELSEKHKAESERDKAKMNEVLAEKAASEFALAAQDILTEAGVPQFKQLLLDPVIDLDSIKAKAEALKAMLAEGIEAGAKKQVQSGSHVSTASQQTVAGAWNDPETNQNMTKEEWAAKKKELGIYE